MTLRPPPGAAGRPPRHGSALRFLQPLSGSGTPGRRGLVSCRCRPWGSPYRALLLAGVARPSRDRWLPRSSPPPYLRCDARGPHPPGFTDARAVWRGGLAPPGAPAPFPPLASQRLPRRLEPRAPSSPRSGGFGCLEALFPPRGRCARRGGFPPSARPVALLGFCPSRALLRSSLGSCHDPVDRSVHRGASTATTGEAIPRRQVRPRRPCGRVDLVGANRSA